MESVISQLAGIRCLQESYTKVRDMRTGRGANDLIWSISSRWQEARYQLRYVLQSGCYQFSPIKQRFYGIQGSCSEWDPQDTIVLKAMKEVLQPIFCTQMNLTSAKHLKGYGGIKAAVGQVSRYAKRNHFVIKTDIADYYQSIQHSRLLDQCSEVIKDKRVLRLLWQVMNRVHDRDGNYRLIEHQSIPRGCALSPLFGAIYLLPLDQLARYNKIDYVRYMDDIVFFFKTRHQLKNMLKKIYSCLDGIQLKLSKPKTWIGRVEKGFDYLGYRISPEGLAIAEGSVGRLQDRLHRLLEQGAGKQRLEKYVKNWMRWFKTGVSLKRTAWINIVSLLRSRYQVQSQFSWC